MPKIKFASHTSLSSSKQHSARHPPRDYLTHTPTHRRFSNIFITASTLWEIYMSWRPANRTLRSMRESIWIARINCVDEESGSPSERTSGSNLRGAFADQTSLRPISPLIYQMMVDKSVRVCFRPQKSLNVHARAPSQAQRPFGGLPFVGPVKYLTYYKWSFNSPLARKRTWIPVYILYIVSPHLGTYARCDGKGGEKKTDYNNRIYYIAHSYIINRYHHSANEFLKTIVKHHYLRFRYTYVCNNNVYAYTRD